ncbi:unnamed protein product [Rhizophagus irregularis]|nr:unnamed protein product [Rhizophagus irregularis]
MIILLKLKKNSIRVTLKHRIVQHLKKCTHFLTATTSEKRDEIFSLLKNNEKELENKRPSSHFSDTTSTFFDSSRKVIIRSSYGLLDNFIVRSLSKEDRKKFNTLLIRLTVSCEWALHWVNNSEAKELFEFLSPFLKLSDRKTLGKTILNDAISEADDAMEIALREDPVGITLTFDGWMNVKSKQLLGVVLMTSEGRPFVWKAADISSERETHLEVMEKTEAMIADLEKKSINVCAVVTDSAGAYAASR